MSTPLINILIRKSRSLEFERCLESIAESGYTKIMIHVYDDTAPRERNGYDYNLFCNELKQMVTSGWWMILDDDDEIIPGALTEIAPYLTDPESIVICQMLRNGKKKPTDYLMDSQWIKSGFIGMPCFFLHASQKYIADFEAVENADYRFIYDVSRKLKPEWVKVAVVSATDVRGNGR